MVDWLYVSQELAIHQVQTAVESSMRTAARSTVATCRYMQKKKEIQNGSTGGIGCLVVVHDDDQTTVAGEGKIYEDFISKHEVNDYPGKNEEFIFKPNPTYNVAKLRVMKFAETFVNMPYDASKR